MFLVYGSINNAVGLIKVSFSVGENSLTVKLTEGSIWAIFPTPSATQTCPLVESMAIPSGLELEVGNGTEFVKFSTVVSNINTSPVDGEVIHTVSGLSPNCSATSSPPITLPLVVSLRPGSPAEMEVEASPRLLLLGLTNGNSALRNAREEGTIRSLGKLYNLLLFA